ncbi:unnamed protein product [Diabrotica balteata]|uniref:pseudouridine 5'-phosphatase n=1 Tax=Diabrotica balteata TaxID=107213 RepID=A0A9N9XFR0_DIABA|nr:unnamed protein product [Diabrotica balteata]
MQFKKVTHVIFDLDGTLIESESIYEKIIDDIAKLYGKRYTEECQHKVLGTREPDTAKIVVQELGLPITPEEFLVLFRKNQETELAQTEMLPGAKELVTHLHKKGIPIAVATSASEKATQIKSKNHQDVFKLFHHIVCGSSDPAVKNGKPAPDIFLVCASRFSDNPNPSDCLVFEDAPSGIRGALSAGMQAVMVPEPHISEELRKPATLVLDSLTQFKPELFGLPAME